MTESHLLYRVKEAVAYLTLNREKQRNAISVEALDLFFEYLDKAEKDTAVRVVCVTGAGDRAFCAGADLGGGMGGGEDGMFAFKKYADLLKRLSAFPKPTVARVNGSCVAGGSGFMLACDIVIAQSRAKFGTPEVNVGLFPMMIGALIFRNVLRKKAMEMILLGEKLTAEEALEMGMVTRVVAPENLDAEVAKVLAALSKKSPVGMKIGKQAFYNAADKPFEEALDFLSEKIGEVAGTKDAVEGITAFIEKREPRFTGEYGQKKYTSLLIQRRKQMSSKDKVVITCAVTGLLTDPSKFNVPVTPDEMAAATREACDAGATIVHAHFRSQQEGAGAFPTWDLKEVGDILAAIREQVPEMIINMSTGVMGADISGPLACLEAFEPHMAACNAGSLNYLKIRQDGVWAWPPILFDNPVEKVKSFLDVMTAHKVIPEFECFDTGIVRSVGMYKANGMFEGDPHISFVMGVDSGMPARPDLLPILKDELPENAHWQVISTGPGREKVWNLHQKCIELGGNVRTGLEDTFYLPNGDRAASNGQLVEALVKIVRETGREVASPAEARAIMGIGR